MLRALGWGGLAISAVTAIFIAGEGGGLGAITAADGNYAFGSIVGIVGGIALILGAGAMPLDRTSRTGRRSSSALDGLGRAGSPPGWRCSSRSPRCCTWCRSR